MRDLHVQWSWFVVFANGAVGVWAGLAQYVSWLRARALWWMVGVAQLSIFVQAGLGAAVANAGTPIPDMHAFYGFVAIIAVGIIYSYRHQLGGRTHLLYGGGSLFVMGLCIRAMQLGT